MQAVSSPTPVTFPLLVDAWEALDYRTEAVDAACALAGSNGNPQARGPPRLYVMQKAR